jgi:hypothetical protein
VVSCLICSAAVCTCCRNLVLTAVGKANRARGAGVGSDVQTFSISDTCVAVACGNGQQDEDGCWRWCGTGHMAAVAAVAAWQCWKCLEEGPALVMCWAANAWLCWGLQGGM